MLKLRSSAKQLRSSKKQPRSKEGKRRRKQRKKERDKKKQLKLLGIRKLSLKGREKSRGKGNEEPSSSLLPGRADSALGDWLHLMEV